MSWHFLRPRSPLLLGDGRSFGGGFYRGSVFPTPQVVLGAARAKVGQAMGFDWDFSSIPGEVKSVVGTPEAPGALTIQSVMLAARKGDEPADLYFPKPADVVVFPAAKTGGPLTWSTLRPSRDAGLSVSAPGGLKGPLAPLLHRNPSTECKPISDPPAFLGIGPFMSHLIDGEGRVSNGHSGAPEPLGEDRVHVRIDNASLAAEEGGIYTAGRLSFDLPLGESSIEMGLAVQMEGGPSMPANALDGVWRLGGKGSLVDASPIKLKTEDHDEMRQAALEGIQKAGGRLRWVLLTPGRFRNGWLPDFLNEEGKGTLGGVAVRLCSAAVNRAVSYSGWDLTAKQSGAHSDSRGRATGAVRPTRLFVPPGSVYFFEVVVEGNDDVRGAAARKIAEALWLRSLVTPDMSNEATEGHRRAAAIDAACGLSRGIFGPWDWFTEAQGVKE